MAGDQEKVQGANGTAAEPGPVRGTALVTAPDTRGLENFDMDDMVFPRVRIVQPSGTGDGWVAGQFLLESESVQVKEITCVFISQKKTRTLFRDRVPVCQSRDAQHPDTGANPDGEMVLCHECPHANWTTKEEDGKRMPPKCTLQYNLLGIPAEGVPFTIALHGMSTMPVRKFLSVFKARGVPLFSARVTLQLEKKENAKGIYFVAKFAGFQWLSPDERVEYEALYNRYQQFDLGVADVVDTEPAAPEDTTVVGEERTPF